VSLQVDDAMWWAMELEMSGLGRMAMSRLTVITVEDIGTGAPLLPIYIAAACDPHELVESLVVLRR